MLKSDRQKVKLIFNWCVKEFGRSVQNDPNVKLIVYKLSKARCGSYFKNRISIYPCSHKSYLDLCNTIIHEYKHYLLSSGDYQTIGAKLLEKGFKISEINEIHPHEIKCRKFAAKYEKECFNQLKKELRKYK